ncbi:hypothetical protein ACFL26_01265 [Patescibacteria group bacterium]
MTDSKKNGEFAVYRVAEIHLDAINRQFFGKLFGALGGPTLPKDQFESSFHFTDDDMFYMGRSGLGTNVFGIGYRPASGWIRIHVNDLDEAAKRLNSAGYETAEDTGGRGEQRITTKVDGVQVIVERMLDSDQRNYDRVRAKLGQ